MTRLSQSLWLVLLFAALAFLALGCEGSSGAGGAGALAKVKAHRSVGVSSVDRINDGLVPPVGSLWNSNRAAIFSGTHAFVDFDLGNATPLVAMALLADNNDTYDVLGSVDGQNFSKLWTAGRHREPGMQWRITKGLEGKSARYVRVQPSTGDASLSISEVAVYSTDPGELPPKLRLVQAQDMKLQLRSDIITAGALLVVLGVFTYQGAAWWWIAALAAAGAFGVFRAAQLLYEVSPVGKVEVSLIRGIVAAVGAALALRVGFSPDKYKPHRLVVTSIFGLLAPIGVLAFFNMGTPQFYDHKNNEPSVVHNYDMRVYFPVAKYFEELKYDGLYLASVLSYAEEHGGIQSARVQNAELRDLRDHRMRRVRDIEAEVVGIRSRFSDSRWREFKKDMAYFWETMGHGGYLGSMADHGGNATPVWLTFAYAMFHNAPASNEVLLWGGALDPLLLLLFAICTWRAFGPLAACIGLIVYGCNDFYMFGSNWAGATLRNDWMVYLGLGACAFKTNRFKLGGALLALSALIRAFPAISLLALGIPLVFSVLADARESNRFPAWSQIWEKNRWFFDAVLGATACVVVAMLTSSFVLGFDAWPLWVQKISSFTASPHVNHLGWLTVVAGSEGNQAEVLRQRWLVHGLGIATYLVLAIWIAARARPDRVALLGIMMMPVVMYPANYYIHFVFLLALLVDNPFTLESRIERKASGAVWALLLGLCAAQYFTVKEADLAVHFYNASVLLMAALLGILVVLLPRDRSGRVDFSTFPFRADGPAPR